MSELERSLAAFYDQEAAARADRGVPDARQARRDRFIERLRAEGRARMLELGVGPGHDAVMFAAAGIAPIGVELSVEHARIATSRGVPALCGTLLELPFADRSFDCGWTMSTLLHVPDADFDAAMRELLRVLHPGSPLAIGLWGGFDREGVNDFDRIHPPRFFSHRTHERAHAMLARHATVTTFETWRDDRSTWEYQYAELRAPQS